MPEKYDNPDYKCAEHEAMAAAWKIVHDVSRGTLHMREQGPTYLPKFPAEHADDYRDRLKTATFFNAYNRTVDGLVGMACKKGPVLGESVPVEIRGDRERGIEGLVSDVDLAGTHLDVFMKDVLKDAFEGHCFILADTQKRPEVGKYGRLTQEDVNESGARPYLVKYKACQATNFLPVIINGGLEIGQITFEEEVSERKGRYGSASVKQYRTFSLGSLVGDGSGLIVSWELQKKVSREGAEDEFETVDGGILDGFARIPVSVVYGQQTGFLQSQPVLLDLALINIKYYQKRSDYDSSLHKAGFPIPVFIGRNTAQPVMTAGAGFGIDVPLQGDAKYMEPQGNSLKAAREDLQDVRSEMAALGLSVLSTRPEAAATATETVIDFSQESSQLETIVRSGRDALERSVGFLARYLGKTVTGSTVTWGGHLKSLQLSPQMIDSYRQMVMDSQLSLETLWQVMQSAESLPADFNPREELKRIFGAGSENEPGVVRDARKEAGGGDGDGGDPAPEKKPGATGDE